MKRLLACRVACRIAFVWPAAVAVAVGRAGAAADDSATHKRIRAERAAAEATYVQQVQACSTQFVVTPCVDAARAQRHAAFARLDREQVTLDEARRKQRAAERLEAVDSKVSGDAARDRAQAAHERSENRRAADAATQLAPAASAATPRHAKATPDEGERAAREAGARHMFELKQVQAEAHRQEVARRNAERAQKAKPGTPLPTPAASAVLAQPEPASR